MASPGQLVDVVAKWFGLTPSTVTQFDRLLAKNGLRTKGGRGLSAARMTSRDAANLIIAIAGSQHLGPSIKDAIESHVFFANMPYEPIVWPDDVKESLAAKRKAIEAEYNVPKLRDDGTFIELRSAVPSFSKVPDRHTFVDALTTLIDAVRNSEIKYHADHKISARAFVTLDGFGSADISIDLPDLRRWSLRYRTTKRLKASDLYWRRSFSIRTMVAVGRILNDDQRG